MTNNNHMEFGEISGTDLSVSRIALGTWAIGGWMWGGTGEKDSIAVFRNSSPAHIRQEVEDTLRRLRTDYIDLYQGHWPDPLVPIDETAAVLDEYRDHFSTKQS